MSIDAQTPQKALDIYLKKAKAIIVAKCVSTSPVMASGDMYSTVEVLFVVKGVEKRREIKIVTTFLPMSAGETYLIRAENETETGEAAYRLRERKSLIPIMPYEDLEKLKTLRPEIVVLRTVNIRRDHLESEIRARAFELDALKEIIKDQ